jgi:hypothetical protein
MGKNSKRIVEILTQQVSEKTVDKNYLRNLLDSNLLTLKEYLKITQSEDKIDTNQSINTSKTKIRTTEEKTNVTRK